MRSYLIEYSEPFGGFRYELRICSEEAPLKRLPGKILAEGELGEIELGVALERMKGSAPFFEYFDRKRGLLSYEFLLKSPSNCLLPWGGQGVENI